MTNTSKTTRRVTVKARNVRLGDWLIGSRTFDYPSGEVDRIEEPSPSVLRINGKAFAKDDKVDVERTYDAPSGRTENA